MKHPDSTNPWDWMQAYDVKRFGEVILDPTEQARWCRAVMLGGLPYMWHKAGAVRAMIFDRLALRPNDKVLLLGECLESSGFVDDVRERIGAGGELRLVDITDQAPITGGPGTYTTTITGTPEPSTFFTALLGGLGLLGRAWWVRKSGGKSALKGTARCPG